MASKLVTFSNGMFGNDDSLFQDEALNLAGDRHRELDNSEAGNNDDGTSLWRNVSKIFTKQYCKTRNDSQGSSAHIIPFTKHISLGGNLSKSFSSAPTKTNVSSKSKKLRTGTDPSARTASSVNNFSKSKSITINSMMPTYETIGPNLTFDVTYQNLIELAKTISSQFSRSKQNLCRRFERLLNQLLCSVERSTQSIQYLIDNFHRYDYSPEIPANGYRTLVVTHGHACLRVLHVLQQIDAKHIGPLMNLMSLAKMFQDLEAWTNTVLSIEHLLTIAVQIVNYSTNNQLFIDATEETLSTEIEYFRTTAVDSKYFFGRTCGFQFCPSLERTAVFVLTGLATFFDSYNRSKTYAAASFALGSRYLLFSEHRAIKCSIVFRDCDYLFCKSFWNLLDHGPLKIGSHSIIPKVTVSKYFYIGPQPIEIGTTIIPPPTSGDSLTESNSEPTSTSTQRKQLVKVKLFSHEIREGMGTLILDLADLENSSKQVLSKSNALLMYIHGGGFVSMSSTTYETHLRPWALGLQIPIVSVDYSLAPEYPYPRAIEECIYAYAWILKNARKLGWTGKTILLAGDSAGGTLVAAVTIRAIETGLRKPDGIICFYAPFILRYSLSPSRIMATMCPLLNIHFLWRCLGAYIGIKFDSKPLGNKRATKAISSVCTIHENNQNSKVIKSSSGETAICDSKGSFHTHLADLLGSYQTSLLLQLRESVITKHPHVSPLCVSDEILRQFPTTYLIGCHLDPCLDDSVSLARRLRQLSVAHHLIVLPKLSHGFLGFYHGNQECKRASDNIMSFIAREHDVDERFTLLNQRRLFKRQKINS